MTLTSLIDFGAIQTAILPLIGVGVTAAALVGATLLAARAGWRAFKSFAK